MAVDEAHPWKVEFAEYLGQDQARLYGYIHSLVRDVHDADDLFQQTTLILWKKFGEFDRRLSFFAWACGVARRKYWVRWDPRPRRARTRCAASW